MNISPNFSFDKQNAAHSFKVLLWSLAAAVVAFVLAFVSGMQVPPQYIFLVPFANTALVALQQWIAAQQRDEK